MTMELQLALAVAGRTDPPPELGQFTPQKWHQLPLLGWLHRHHRRKTLQPPWSKRPIRQARGHAANDGRWHLSLPFGVPAQAGAQRREQPPADPFHWPRQGQLLGNRQPPSPLRMGGIDNHRHPGCHCPNQPLVQPLFDRTPGPLHRGIAKDFGPDPIG